jgi:GT2 family glycosyltransferase
MNRGLLEAAGEIVLFLDDDIIPSPGLVEAHVANYVDATVWAVVGQILQPGQAPDQQAPPTFPGPGLWSDLDFPFNGTQRRQIYNCMAGNLSVRRDKAIVVGGMDMNFKGVAYRFETEFARRLTDAGGVVMFDPAPRLQHLQAPSGGTRTHGNHLTSASPAHGVGEYYFAFKSASGPQGWRFMLQRMYRSVGTRFHLRHPWWIPVKLLGEFRALCWAWRLQRRGPRYISTEAGSG